MFYVSLLICPSTVLRGNLSFHHDPSHETIVSLSQRLMLAVWESMKSVGKLQRVQWKWSELEWSKISRPAGSHLDMPKQMTLNRRNWNQIRFLICFLWVWSQITSPIRKTPLYHYRAAWQQRQKRQTKGKNKVRTQRSPHCGIWHQQYIPDLWTRCNLLWGNLLG